LIPDALSAVLKAVGFLSLLQAAGIALVIAVLGRQLAGSVGPVRRLGWLSAATAIVCVTGRQGIEAARMAGEMSGVLDPSMQITALTSSGGKAFAAQIVGLVVIVASLGMSVRSNVPAVIGALLVVAAFTLTGHTSVGTHRWIQAILLGAHLVVIAFWIGGLAGLYIASLREPPATAARVVTAFSAIAMWVVPSIFLVGVGLIVALVPSLAVFSQAYGRLLVLKALLFSVLMGLAAANRWEFGPRIGSGEKLAATSFRRTVAIEYILICATLTATAIMTTFYSPEPA
jgi:putative copper export protein